MLKDNFGREITYLRFSITQRCNFNCVYCHSYNNNVSSEPSLDDIAFIVNVFSSLGFRKIRITGGEPLVRNDIVDIVRVVKQAKFDEIVMTTNGYRLYQIAKDLKDAGLDRINISLDSLDRSTFLSITSLDKFDDVYKGLSEAISVGFNPVKINTVLLRGINESDILPLVEMTKDKDLIVRFIELMPVKGNSFFDEYFLSYRDAIKIIESKYKLEKHPTPWHEVARYYKIIGFKGLIGFITSISQHFCNNCNRLRLTSTFKIFPCLFSSEYVSIKDAVLHRDEKLLKDLIMKSINIKQLAHREIKVGTKEFIENMQELGG